MLRVSTPPKISTPWGAQAGAYRRAISNISQIGKVNGVASWPDGFVPLNFTPVAAGGVPPFGKDMNGALYSITLWDQWYQAGGAIRYDPTFQTQIGGYPAEACVVSTSVNTPFLVWQSIVDNNLSNPDAGGAGWQTPVFPDPSVQGGSIIGALTLVSSKASNSRGVYLKFIGNGTVSANKYIHVHDGNFAILNNSQQNEIFTLDDAGNLTNLRDVTANGTVDAGDLIVDPGDASITGTTTTGDLLVIGDTHTGPITASGIITTTQSVHAGSAVITGPITGQSLAVSDDISGETGTFSGALVAASGTFIGAVVADSAAITHALAAETAAITHTTKAGSLVIYDPASPNNPALPTVDPGPGRAAIDKSLATGADLSVGAYAQIAGNIYVGGPSAASDAYMAFRQNGGEIGTFNGYIRKDFINHIITINVANSGGTSTPNPTNVVTIDGNGGLTTGGIMKARADIIAGWGGGVNNNSSVIRFRRNDTDNPGTGFIYRDNSANTIVICPNNPVGSNPGLGITIFANGDLEVSGHISGSNISLMENALAALTNRVAALDGGAGADALA